MHKTNKMKKKSVLITISLVIILLLVGNVFAAVSDIPKRPDPGNVLSKAGENLKKFFSGKWLLDSKEQPKGATLVTFLRILFWIFLFSVIYGVLQFLAGTLPWLTRPIQISLSIVITLIAVFMMPFEALVVVAIQYGYIGVIIMMFPLYGALGWAIYWSYQGPQDLWKRAVRICALAAALLALWSTAELFQVIVDSINTVIPGLTKDGAREGGGLYLFFLIPISYIKDKVFK